MHRLGHGVLGKGFRTDSWPVKNVIAPVAVRLHTIQLHRKDNMICATVYLFTMQPTPEYVVLLRPSAAPGS